MKEGTFKKKEREYTSEIEQYIEKVEPYQWNSGIESAAKEKDTNFRKVFPHIIQCNPILFFP